MKDIIERYTQQKMQALCKQIGVDLIHVNLSSWCIGHDRNAHLYFSNNRFNYDEVVDLALEYSERQGLLQEAFILKNWDFYSNSSLTMNYRENIHDTLVKEDLEFDSESDDFNNEDLAYSLIDDAKERVVKVINEVTEMLTDAGHHLQREVFEYLQDFHYHTYEWSFEGEPVREKKTKNFIVQVYEEGTDTFLYHDTDDEYLIETIESFKDGKIVGLDLKVVVLDRHTEEELGCAYLSSCTRTSEEKPVFSPYVSELVSEAIGEARDYLNQHNQLQIA